MNVLFGQDPVHVFEGSGDAVLMLGARIRVLRPEKTQRRQSVGFTADARSIGHHESLDDPSPVALKLSTVRHSSSCGISSFQAGRYGTLLSFCLVSYECHSVDNTA